MKHLRLFFRKHPKALLVTMSVEVGIIVTIAGATIASAATGNRLLCGEIVGSNLSTYDQACNQPAPTTTAYYNAAYNSSKASSDATAYHDAAVHNCGYDGYGACTANAHTNPTTGDNSPHYPNGYVYEPQYDTNTYTHCGTAYCYNYQNGGYSNTNYNTNSGSTNTNTTNNSSCQGSTNCNAYCTGPAYCYDSRANNSGSAQYNNSSNNSNGPTNNNANGYTYNNTNDTNNNNSNNNNCPPCPPNNNNNSNNK